LHSVLSNCAATLAEAAKLAVADWRDLRIEANGLRANDK
jgi:hypothetical protein